MKMRSLLTNIDTYIDWCPALPKNDTDKHDRNVKMSKMKTKFLRFVMISIINKSKTKMLNDDRAL